MHCLGIMHVQDNAVMRRHAQTSGMHVLATFC